MLIYKSSPAAPLSIVAELDPSPATIEQMRALYLDECAKHLPALGHGEQLHVVADNGEPLATFAPRSEKLLVEVC